MSKQSTRQAAKQNNRQAVQQGAGQTAKQNNRPPTQQGSGQTTKQSAQPPVQQSTRQAAKQNNRPVIQQSTRPFTKQERRRDRREEQRRREEERRRAAGRRRVITGSVVAALVVAAVAVGLLFIPASPFYVGAQSQHTIVNPADPPVDGVYCDAGEQLVYHIHVHVSLYLDGQPTPISAQVGIPTDGSCLYWLHTHDTTGVIHVESPTQRTYTFGQFLDLWGTQFLQLKYPNQLSQPDGWTVYVNGKLYKGNFRNIPLNAHTLITLGYNSPGMKPDTTYNWGNL